MTGGHVHGSPPVECTDPGCRHAGQPWRHRSPCPPAPDPCPPLDYPDQRPRCGQRIDADHLGDRWCRSWWAGIATEQRDRAIAAEAQVERLTKALERGPAWHAERFPTATIEHVALKLAEEVGEVCAAVIATAGNEHPERASEVVAECADVFIVLTVLVGRYFPNADLTAAVNAKVAALVGLDADPPREPTRHEEADALFAMKILPAPADPQEAT